MKIETALTLALSFSLLTSAPLAQGKSGDKIPDVAKAVRHDTSIPLREIAPKSPPHGPPREIQNTRKIRSNQTFQSVPTMDPVRQMSAESISELALTPLPDFTFEGTSDEDNEAYGGGRVVPPDTEGDVGPDHYIQMNNVVFEVFDKDGNSVYGPAANNTLWSGFGGVCEDLNNGDPIVFHDQLADRWVFSQLAIGNQSPVPGEADGHQCVAVSETSDPTGSYHRYDFRVSESQDGGYSIWAINDYPKLGLWPDGYYVTANEFQCETVLIWTTCTYSGAKVAALERDRMLAGEDAGMVSFLLPGNQNFSLQPSHWEGPTPPPTGSPNPFLQIFDSEDNGSTGDDGYRLWDFSVDWDNPANSTFDSLGMVSTNEFDSNLCGYTACVPQPSPGESLDTLSQFTMFRLMYRNFPGSHEALVVNHTVDADGNDTAGIRWAELRRTQPSGAWSLHQTGTFAPDDGLHRWMGSIAMDGAGNIALSYSLSGTTQFPSLAYATRCQGDPLGELSGGEEICHWGSGAQTGSSNRWGDYSTISVDPDDDRTFWFTNAYYQATGSFDFFTRICVIPPLDCDTSCVVDADCDDSLVCNGVETCVAGSCQAGTPMACDDGVSCTDDSCNESTDLCDNVPNDSNCTDSLFCNGAETCDTVFDCQPGSAPCPGPDCDEATDTCTGATCDNDGTCEAGEDCNNCSNDCISATLPGASCGNGVCEAGNGEDCVSCPVDCNGLQTGKPSGRFCCGDGDGTNPLSCGHVYCSTGGFECTATPLPGSYCCGDAVCESLEDNTNCELDCGAAPVCGDSICDAGEDACNCSDDCGPHPLDETGMCSNGVDDDCDLDFDCDDTDCTFDAACEVCILGQKGDPCTVGTDCCSGSCKRNDTCR